MGAAEYCSYSGLHRTRLNPSGAPVVVQVTQHHGDRLSAGPADCMPVSIRRFADPNVSFGLSRGQRDALSNSSNYPSLKRQLTISTEASAHVVESTQTGSNADCCDTDDYGNDHEDVAKADDDCMLDNPCTFLTRQLITHVSINIVGSGQPRMQGYSNAADTYKQDKDPWRSQ